MAFTRKQAVGANAVALTVAVTLNNVVAGSLILVLTESHGAMTLSDAVGNAWIDGTDFATIPNSSKHLRWHWVLAAVSGTYVITGTSATSSNQYIQAAEYGWPGATGTADTADAANNAASSAATTVTSGAGIVAGSLIVTGAGLNAQGAAGFNADANDTIVLDPAAKSAGEAAGSMTMAFEENKNLSSPAGAYTAGFTFGGAVDWSSTIMSFAPAAGGTTFNVTASATVTAHVSTALLVRKTITAVPVSISATVKRAVAKAMSTTVAISTTLARSVGKVIAPQAVVASVSQSKQVSRTVSAAVASTVTASKQITRTIGLTVSTGVALTKQIMRTITASAVAISTTITSGRAFIRTISVGVSTGVTVVRQIAKPTAVSVATGVAITRAVAISQSIPVSTGVTIAKRIARAISVAVATLVSVATSHIVPVVVKRTGHVLLSDSLAFRVDLSDAVVYRVDLEDGLAYRVDLSDDSGGV